MAKTYLRTGRISWSPLTASQQTMLANVAGIAIGSTFSATLDSPTETFLIGNGVISVPSSAVVASSGDTVGTVPVDNGDGTYSWGAASGSGVTTFNTRSGAVTLSKADVTGTGLAAADVSADASGAAAAAQAAAIAASAQGLVPTAVKTTNYSAAAGDFVPVDASGGVVTVTLPSAPADKTRIGVKIIAQAGTPNTVTIARGGSDVFNKAGGSTSLTLSALFQSVLLQYQSSTGIWYAQSTDYQLPASVVSVSSGTPTANQIPIFTGTGNAVTPGTPNTNPGVYNIQNYGAKCDAVTLGDGAMSATTTLTSATAVFTANDVGKRIVVNNALGAGSHLYTTIATFTDANHVVLTATATATITNAPFTYGTDDLAAITSAIAAAPAGATILIPQRTSVYGTITPTKAVTFTGNGVTPVWGPFATAGSVVVPTASPYLRGSVICQMQASADVFAQSTISGEPVNFTGLGIYFAGMFKTTGNGINFTCPVLSGHGFDNGIVDFFWQELWVFGHDGTHRAAYVRNPLMGTCSHIRSAGGGGWKFDANSDRNPYGNLELTHAYHAGLDGALNGFDFSTTFGDAINLITLIRPQTISGSAYIGTTFAAWGTLTWSGLDMDASGAIRVVLIGPDMENGNVWVGSEIYTVGTYTFGGAITFGGGTALPDSLPFASHYAPGGSGVSRRLNRDGSLSVDLAESAGSAVALVNNTVTNNRWGITTDSTERLQIPGTLQATGRAVTAAAAAGIGTSPPPVLIQGSDLAGQVLFGSGTGPAAGAVASFTFARTMAAAPVVQLTPANSATQALGLYISAASTSGFTVSAANAPTGSQAISTYSFSYHTIDSGGVPAVPVDYENFVKADSATTVGTPEIGSAPTAAAGTWGISSNQGYLAVDGDAQHANSLVYASGKADCTITLKVNNWVSGCGIAFRAASATSMFYVDGNTLWLRTAAGTFTNLGALSPTFRSGDTVSVVLSGSSIKVFVNGTLSLSVTNATNQAVQNHGLYSSNITARFGLFQIL